MSGNLSYGALARLCQGEDVVDPVLQVLGHKPIAGGGQERYRLLLSDGQFTNSFSMLATQLNHMIHDKKLEQFTLIKVKKQVVNSVAGQAKKVVVILELEVVTPGAEVGQKFGNPVQMGTDGKAAAPSANQNTNPNAGAAAAVKRPAASSNDQPPVKTTPAGGRSVLTPRAPSSSAGQPITPIASITPYQNKWTIKARVSSKTDIKTWNKSTGSGKLFSMDLMDESGEIRITAFKEQVDAFYDKAVVGKVYFISNCSVKNANKQWNRLKNEYELTFKDNGTFELCEDDISDVPSIAYNFVAISDLPTIGPEDKEKPIDVIGVARTAGELANIVTKAGKELTKREVTLVDRSETDVTLTLWGSTAEQFDASSNPVLAVKNVRVSDYNGVTLSGGDVLVNPDLPIAHELAGWWDNEGRSMQCRSLTVAGARGGEGGGSSANFKLIADAKQDCMAGAEKSDYYNVLAMTSFFSKDKALYKACGENLGDGKECNKKAIDQGDGTFRCEKCQKDKTTFNWRAILQINMADCSDNLWATCFQETAEKILGVTAQELGDALERDEERYNQIFQEATFKTFSFRMRAKEDTYNDERRMKHTVVSIESVNWNQHCANLIREIEALGGTLPSDVDKALYVK